MLSVREGRSVPYNCSASIIRSAYRVGRRPVMPVFGKCHLASRGFKASLACLDTTKWRVADDRIWCELLYPGNVFECLVITFSSVFETTARFIHCMS